MKKLTKKEVMVKGKVWTKESLQELVSKNDTALYRALLRIYDKQTETEKAVKETHDWNEVGFSGVDGRIMTSIADFYVKRKYMTIKQKAIVRTKMKKYCGQLLKLMAVDNRIENSHFFKTRGKNYDM